MRLLFVIGNGLDIALGLKTSYQAFYDYYQKQPSPDKDIVALKQNMEEGRYSTWADLELGLGQYTALCPSELVFLKCLEDIRAHLGEYLSEQEKGLLNMSGFSKFVLEPWSFIEPVSLRGFHNFTDNRSGEDVISIVTLNYTSTIEKLYKSDHVRGLKSIIHLHGTIDSIVMGVNDEEQIANKVLAENMEFKEEFVKPIYNDACMNNKNNEFSELIADSNVFILYGTSIGESDKKWWHAIGERLISAEDPAALFYFPYDKGKDVEKHQNYRLRWTKAYFSELLEKLGIKGEYNPNDIEQRVFIGINKSLFKPVNVVSPRPPKAF